MIRRIIFFAIGVFLSAILNFAYADTIPATYKEFEPEYPGVIYGGQCLKVTNPALVGACIAIDPRFNLYQDQVCINSSNPTNDYYQLGSNCNTPAVPAGYSCPAGYTLDSNGTTCTGTPSTGQDCPTGTVSSGTYKGEPSAISCAPNGCYVQFSGIYPTVKFQDGTLGHTGQYDYYGGKKGECTAGAMPSPDSGSTKPTTPPCAPGDGVMTSTSGKVACVPAGTPGSETPKAGSKTTTKTNPDGSTTTITTNTTCTGAGACSSTTTTTTTGVGGGTTPGQAGTPGTTTENSDKTGEPDPEKPDTPCDPKASMCSSPEVSELYSKKTETFAGPLSRFTAGLRSSVLGDSSGSFFNVTIPGGTCPDWNNSVSVLGATFAVNLTPVFCSQVAINAMNVVGSILMVVAAFFAFKWAIL